MATWADIMIEAKNRNLIRKSLAADVSISSMATAVPATIVDVAGVNLVLPPAFDHLGWHSEDGLAWAREVELSDIASHGANEPTRSDTRRVTNSLEVTFQETNIHTLGLQLGVALSPDLPASGEFTHDESPRPRARQFRMLALSVDDSDFGEIYIGKLYPSAKVTATTPGAWTDGDSAQSTGVTISAYQDPVLGTSVRHFAGGPGWKGLAEAMGFTVAGA